MRPLFRSGQALALRNHEEISTKKTVYYVRGGLLALYAQIDGHEVLLYLFKQGEVIQSDILPVHSRLLPLSFSLRGYGPTKLLQLSASDFKTAISQEPTARQHLAAYQQLLTEQLLARLACTGYKDVYRRLVACLLFLAERFGSVSGSGMAIDAPMTHRQLATSISSTRETVNKLMKQLENEGLVMMKNKTIRLAAPTKLAAELNR